MAGPYGTLIMADLGAEVIKIENPEGGDLSRATVHYTHKGESAYYLSFNRNKKSLTLNLRSDEGREIFIELVKISDVVYDNFRSGTLEKLQIDYPSLKKVNPKIISCSVTGFGSNSRYKDRPALDLLIQAMGGHEFHRRTRQAAFPPGISHGRPGGRDVRGHCRSRALYYREITGKGQQLDIAMLDAQIPLMTYGAQYYLLEKVIPEPIGLGHVSAVPIRAFMAKDGKYLTIDAAQDKFFQNLCQVLGIEQVAQDPRFTARSARLKNRDALMKLLEDKFLQRNRDEWLDLLIKGDVPAGPVNNLAEALSNPSVLARNMVISVIHLGEEIKMVGNPIKGAEIKEDAFSGSPTLGQHTEEILYGYLRYSREQIGELKKNKIL